MFIDWLVNSVHLGMVLVDRDMRIKLWNRGSEELWGLRSEEVLGTSLTSLDIGLRVEPIKPMIGNAFVDPGTTMQSAVDAVNRRGRGTRLRITSTGFRADGDSVHGALLLMEIQQ